MIGSVKEKADHALYHYQVVPGADENEHMRSLISMFCFVFLKSIIYYLHSKIQFVSLG